MPAKHGEPYDKIRVKTHMGGIKRNMFYSGMLTAAGYLFPLLTYPYVSRVLGVGNIGICGFVDNIVNYFILLSMMGMSILGIREIASCGKDREKRDSVFSSMMLLNATFTLLAVVLLISAMYLVGSLYHYRQLLWLGVFKLFFNMFLMEWLFKGLEEFRYITLRTVSVRCLYVVAVFVFVRDSDDYAVYYLLGVLMVAANAIVNGFYSRHSVSFSLKNMRLKGIVAPFLVFGVYLLANSMYTTFNVVYLGFACGDTEVGYYTTSTRIFAIMFAMFSAFTGVMLPRMSALAAADRREEFNRLVDKSVYVLMAFSFPMASFMLAMSPQIVDLISGPGYEGAVMPMRIIAPLMIVIGFEEILVVQILMPMHKDRTVLFNSFAGAALGVFLNLMLTDRFLSVGSALVWVSSELLIFVLSLIQVRRIMNFKFPTADVLRYVLVSVLLVGILYVVGEYIPAPSWIVLSVGGVTTVGYSILCMRIILKGKLPCLNIQMS